MWNNGGCKKIDGGRECEGKGGALLRGREQRRQLGDKVGENMGEERGREREHTLITVLHHHANTGTFR